MTINSINIIKPSTIETTSLGVAYLAGIQAGIIKNTLQIEKFWKKEKIFKPKIKKKEIEYIIKKWKKTLALLIKLNL